MVYGPQRRHAVASFATTVQALGLLQHLYTPNILILVARILAQIQINGSALIHPNRSLFALCMMLSLLNLAAGFLHFLDFLGEMNGGKGLVLDFVGQSRPASLTRILLLDLGIYALQLTSLCVSYVNNHSNNLPQSPAFPYDDVLLPPPSMQSYGRGTSSQSIFDEDEEEEEEDIESARRKRQKGKGREYQAVQGDEIWLDDDEEEETETRARSSATFSNRRGITEPPMIFSLSLQHLIHLIISLPAPSPPPRAFSGGTPSTSPPRTPVVSTPAHLPTQSTPAVQDRVAHENEEDEEGDAENEGVIGGRTPSGRNTPMAGEGRIPGEWRTGEGGGNGG